MAGLIAVGKSVATALGGAGSALQVGGTAVSALGQLAAGRSARAAANFEAAQLEQSAKAEQAMASREAEQRRKEKNLVISRARAVGAAGGGGLDYDLLGALEEEGELRARDAVFSGEETAQGRLAQAGARRAEGRAASTAAFYGAGSSVLSQAGTSFLRKYG